MGTRSLNRRSSCLGNKMVRKGAITEVPITNHEHSHNTNMIITANIVLISYRSGRKQGNVNICIRNNRQHEERVCDKDNNSSSGLR